MLYIFLDTNIFIHFSDFEQIDWQTILETKEEIVITLTPTVIDELDKHKYNKNQKISKRIKKLLPRIEKFLDNPSLCKYALKYISTRPIIETFTEYNLDKREQDDTLLATLLEFSKSLNKRDKIIYVTNDVGPRLKAKSLNIPTLKLSDEYLSPNEPDETESKNIALLKELNDLKSKIPVVSLFFKNENTSIKFKQNKNGYTKSEFIESEIMKVKMANPYLVHRQTKKTSQFKPAITFLDNSTFTLSESQIDDYNKQLDEYFKEYELHAAKLFEVFDFNMNSIEVELVLHNKGTSPAIDIDIEIHFPDGFELYREEDIPKITSKISLPYKPEHRYDFNLNFNPMSISSIRSNQNINLGNINLSQPTIKKTNSYLVSYHIQSLKHNQTFELEKLYAKFPDISTAKGFTIDYKLVVANVSKVITGQMNIYFEE